MVYYALSRKLGVLTVISYYSVVTILRYICYKMKVDITIEELERIVVNAFMAGYNTTKEEMNTLSDNDPITDQILFLLAKYRVKNM